MPRAFLARRMSWRGDSSGRGIGRKVVVPTLNLATKAEILPANGVYATQTRVPETAA